MSSTSYKVKLSRCCVPQGVSESLTYTNHSSDDDKPSSNTLDAQPKEPSIIPQYQTIPTGVPQSEADIPILIGKSDIPPCDNTACAVPETPPELRDVSRPQPPRY